MMYPSGKIYHGDWVYKRRHGFGYMKKNGKKTVEARWVNNMMLKDGQDSFIEDNINLMEDVD